MGVADRPGISGHCSSIGSRQFRATLGRHGTSIVARARHAVGHRLGDRRKAAIAEDPNAGSQVRTDWRPSGIGPMASAAGAVAGLAVEDTVAQRNLILGGAGRHRKIRGGAPASA